MKTKVDSALISKDISFKKIDINRNVDIGKNNNFQDKIKSFTKDDKDEYRFKKDIKTQNKDDKNNVGEKNKSRQDKSKIEKEIQTKQSKKPKDKIEKPKENTEKDEDIIESSEVQAHLISLFNISEKPSESLDLKRDLVSNKLIEMDINLGESLLSLNNEIEDISLEEEIKKINYKLLDSKTLETDNPDKDTQTKDIPEDIKVESKVSISNQLEEKELPSKTKSLDLGNAEETNEEENTSKIQFHKSDNVDLSKNKEDHSKDKEGLGRLDMDTDDLDITRKNEEETDKEDKTFVIDKKTEIDPIKDLEKLPNKPDQVDMKKTIQQIAEKMKFSIDNNKNQITISLKPETLGELKMEIEVVNNVLTAKLMVDNEKTKELIQNNLFQLKDEIKDTGLEIKSFEVFVGNGNDFSKHEREQFNFNKFNKKNNLKVKKALKEKENLAYNDPLIDSINNISNEYLKGSLNLLA